MERGNNFLCGVLALYRQESTAGRLERERRGPPWGQILVWLSSPVIPGFGPRLPVRWQSLRTLTNEECCQGYPTYSSKYAFSSTAASRSFSWIAQVRLLHKAFTNSPAYMDHLSAEPPSQQLLLVLWAPKQGFQLSRTVPHIRSTSLTNRLCWQDPQARLLWLFSKSNERGVIYFMFSKCSSEIRDD